MRRWGVMRGVWCGMGVGLVALIFVAGPVSVSSAGFPGRDGRIAFAWAAGRSASPLSCLDLFSTRPNGSDRQRLTRGCPWEYSDPAYSATGKQIVFVRGHEPFPRDHRGLGIYVTDADGTHVRRITTASSDENPSFSPDGKLIVFDRWLKRSRRTQLFLASSSGGSVRQLTDNRHGVSEATFSPGGREIAFVLGGSNIFAMRLDRSHRRQLTHAPVRLEGWDDQPDFSPDGRRIVFRCGAGDFGAVWQICIMRADGADVQHLTPGGPFGFAAEDPVFSPDGHRIAFLAQIECRPHGCGNNHVFVYTMRTDGSHRRKVYDLGPNRQVGGIAWQPLR